MAKIEAILLFNSKAVQSISKSELIGVSVTSKPRSEWIFEEIMLKGLKKHLFVPD